MATHSERLKRAAQAVSESLQRTAANAVESQRLTLRRLLEAAERTSFGKEHRFQELRSEADFREAVPVRDYDGFQPYFERIVAGEADVSWPGRPQYYALSSGTTSGKKIIPITEARLHSHFNANGRMLLNRYGRTGSGAWLDGTAVILASTPALSPLHGVPSGHLSGILQNVSPTWIGGGALLPSPSTAAISDWEEKVEAMVAETIGVDVRFIAGLPSWTEMYFDYLLKRTGSAAVLDVFPGLALQVHGGVDYKLYRERFRELIGAAVPTLETFLATEAFVAFQDAGEEDGLLLNLAAGTYFEFVRFGGPEAAGARLSLREVEVGVDYAVLVSNDGGLWAYRLGDVVRFVSTDPPRIVFRGRTAGFIAAVGERVIAREVEAAIREASSATGARVAEFSVAPQLRPPEGGRPYHQWLVEFGGEVPGLQRFAEALDDALLRQNANYEYFRRTRVLGMPKVVAVAPGAFRDYMRDRGMLGGQFKVPRLRNDRTVADALRLE